MSVTLVSQPPEPAEQQVVLRGLNWDLYQSVNDALAGRRNPGMIYCDGSLTIVVTSRRHDWYAERLDQRVVVLAEVLQIPWEDAGHATFRRKEMNAGLEGDKTFYLAGHAELMKGPRNIDLTVQPPPDLAIEVEVTHLADAAMDAWGRLGVVEIWRFDPISEEFGFWLRQSDGSYAPADRGAAFPALSIEDVPEQMRLASELGASAWHIQLRGWAQNVIRGRVDPTG